MLLIWFIYTVLLSFYFWGILRTAVWIIPGLVFADLMPHAWISILSFFALTSLFAPYERGAFDLRKLQREKWVLILFLCGVLTGSFSYPSELYVFGIGSLYPLFLIQILKALRHPPSQVLFLNKKVRWLPLIGILGLAAYLGIERFHLMDLIP